MSDTENNLPSPSKEKESEMETTNNDEAEKKETKNEIVPNVDSPPPSEPNTPSKSPENAASKPKKKRKTALGYVSDSEEELPMGLLERPFIIESGKRERKKTDRLPVGENFGSGQKKKKIDIAEGKGEKLKNIALIEFKINHHKAEDLKFFHRMLFSRVASTLEIKKNIKLFSGFPFEVDDKEYAKRMIILNKSTIPQIKQMCEVLDLERKGTKLEIINRLMNFLMKPTDSGKAAPTPKKRKSRTSGEKRKRTKTDGTSEEKDEDEDDVKDTTLEDDESLQEDNAEGDENESEKEAAKPPKKKRRTESPKPQKSKTGKPKAEKTKAEKPKPKPKKEKKEKENGKKEKSKAKKGSDDSSDDEPLSKSITDPPGNDEIKKLIEKILDGADLEEVTMKTVVKQVYAKYPKFDLSDKKEFIKCTVKEIISFND